MHGYSCVKFVHVVVRGKGIHRPVSREARAYTGLFPARQGHTQACFLRGKGIHRPVSREARAYTGLFPAYIEMA